MLVYFIFVLGIGFLLKRKVKTSTDFFLAGRAIPAWVCGLAFISANLGAQEVIGMAASGAKYGIDTSHFYWIGAIPAIVFVGIFMMPIYNEVLQFFRIVAGFLPLVWLGLKNVGGWHGLTERLPRAYTHSWAGMSNPNTNPLGVEWFGLVMGLGFVLSFGYWCTDFLVVQRAMAADSMSAARRTPLIAAIPKMFFPFLVILPGLIAIALPNSASQTSVAWASTSASVAQPAESRGGVGIIPPKMDASTGLPKVDKDGNVVLDYDLAIPNMLLHYFPTGILGLGLTALLASFMSGMAGNVTAFNTVWTYDIYQSYVRPGAPDGHYLAMGRFATVFGVALSILAAYVAASFNNIMDFLQLVFAFVNAPLFATFALGMFWKRATGHGAFWGLLAGTLGAGLHYEVTDVASSASLLPKLA